MNQPAPRELCEKLQAMGCVSESGLYWFEVQLHAMMSPEWLIQWGKNKPPYWTGKDYVPTFYQNDFTGATIRAIQNSMTVFGDKVIECFEVNLWDWNAAESDGGISGKAYNVHRHNMIDVVDEPWFQYLERTMIKVEYRRN